MNVKLLLNVMRTQGAKTLVGAMNVSAKMDFLGMDLFAMVCIIIITSVHD